MDLFALPVKHRTVDRQPENGTAQKLRRRATLPIEQPRLLPPFKYKPLPDRRFIRLMRCVDYDTETREILATIQTFSIDECPEYFALSYTWGNPVRRDNDVAEPGDSLPSCKLLLTEIITPLPLCIDDGHAMFDQDLISRDKTKMWAVAELRDLRIGKSLSDFLLCLNDDRFRGEGFPDKDTFFWIDAVCISQSDEAEKAAQIPLMGEIYSNASRVVAWLGPEESGFDILVWATSKFLPAVYGMCFARLSSDQVSRADIFNILHEYNPLEDILFEQLHISGPRNMNSFNTWRSYCEFLYRHIWFSRAWVLQEVCLAHALYVFCGQSSIRGEALLLLENLLTTCGWTTRLEWVSNCAIYQGLEEVKDNRDFFVSPRDNSLIAMGEDTSVRVVAESDVGAQFPDPELRGKKMVEERYLSAFPFDRLHILLSTSRSRETSYDADKVNCVMGMVAKMLPTDERHIFDIAPSISAVETYLWIAKLSLENAVRLNLLSDVEDSSKTKLKELPSWVPDYSVLRGRVSLPINSDFRAAGERVEHGRRPKVLGQKLRLFGTMVGHVEQAFELSERDALFVNLLTLAGTMAPVYKWTGEHRLEALLHLLLANYSKQTIPPSLARYTLDALRTGFLSNLAFTAEILQGAAESDFEGVVFAAYLSLVLPDWHQYIGFEAEAEQFLIAMDDSGNILDKIFATSSGFLGIGPPSLEPGDSIWLFERGTVAYALRKVPCPSDELASLTDLHLHETGSEDETSQGVPEEFRFLGDCAVYGIMDGELVAEEPGREFGPVLLV